MKKRFTLCLMTIFSIFLSVSAENIPAAIRALHPDGESIDFAFTETKVMPKIKKTTVKQGTMHFVAPDDLRVDYTDPAGDYMLITKEKFEVQKKGRVQNFNIKNPERRMGLYRSTLLLCMSGDVEKVANINEASAEYKTVGGRYVCTITAKHASAREIASLVLEYDTKSGRLLRMVITEGNDNYTTYEVK